MRDLAPVDHCVEEHQQREWQQSQQNEPAPVVVGGVSGALPHVRDAYAGSGATVFFRPVATAASVVAVVVVVYHCGLEELWHVEREREEDGRNQVLEQALAGSIRPLQRLNEGNKGWFRMAKKYWQYFFSQIVF